MAMETTPVQPVSQAGSQQPASRQAGRRTGSADGANANSPFAQLLKGQRDGVSPQAGLAVITPDVTTTKPPSADAKDGETSSSEESADSPEAKAARKLPSKTQLGAEDLAPEAMALKNAHAGGGADTLSRLLGAGRAQARQAALGAERGRDTRQAGAPGVGDEAADKGATAATGFASLLAATEPRAVDAASGAVAATTALEAPQQNTAAVSVEGILPSLAAPGEAAPIAPAPQQPPLPAVPDAYATLAASPGSEAFPAALGAQLSTWINDGVEYAKLELNPSDLGPIDVRISLRDGDTRIELGSDVASTRDALEQALPQLAEALGDVGLAMSGGQVSDQASGDRSGNGDAQAQARQTTSWLRGGSHGGDGIDAQSAPPARPPVNPRALLDMYA